MLNNKELLTKMLEALNLAIDTADATIGTTTHGANAVSTTDCTKTGYTPLGIIGYNWATGTRQNWFSPYRLYISGNTVNYSFLNAHATDSASGTVTFYILYMKK